MLTYIEILAQIGQILKTNLNDATVRLTPWQSYAGQGYDKLTTGIVVLINLGSVFYNYRSYSAEDRNIRLSIIETDANIEISVGKRNLKDEDDFTIEDIVMQIEGLLKHQDFEGFKLMPATISAGVIDEAKNYWRHITFRLTSRERIGA